MGLGKLNLRGAERFVIVWEMLRRQEGGRMSDILVIHYLCIS
jgi:hypothetical protein